MIYFPPLLLLNIPPSNALYSSQTELCMFKPRIFFCFHIFAHALNFLPNHLLFIRHKIPLNIHNLFLNNSLHFKLLHRGWTSNNCHPRNRWANLPIASYIIICAFWGQRGALHRSSANVDQEKPWHGLFNFYCLCYSSKDLDQCFIKLCFFVKKLE